MITEAASPDRFDRVVASIAVAARAGVQIIQVRQPTLDGGPLLVLVRRCLETLAGTRTRLVVNERLDVALAAGAHGVHLRGDSIAAPRLRALAPRGFLIGRSVHTVAEAVSVSARGGLDYLVFGTTFPTTSKPGRKASGVEALGEVCAATVLPVLAVGGVTPSHFSEIARSGAAGFAAISLFAGDASLSPVMSAARDAWGGAGAAT
jgi:thiamine-phosphate pyrophosphorylase